MSTFLQEFQKTARAAWYPWLEANFSDWSDSTALVKDLLNEANQLHSQISPARIVDISIATSNWVPSYALPADFSRIIDVYYYQWTRKISIEKYTEDSFLTIESVVSSNTQYLFYTIRPTTDISGNVVNNIWLYPTPVGGNSIYVKYYAVSPVLNTDPTSSTDKATIMVAPAWFWYLNVYWALANIFEIREQPVQAQRFQDKYDKLYKSYLARVVNKNDDIVIKARTRYPINPNYYPTSIWN